jgi:hypothetical protein
VQFSRSKSKSILKKPRGSLSNESVSSADATIHTMATERSKDPAQFPKIPSPEVPNL